MPSKGIGTARANRIAAGVSPLLYMQLYKKPNPRHTASFSNQLPKLLHLVKDGSLCQIFRTPAF
jgi:hypothetical protein